jgi:hypothetical protein
VRVQPVVVVYNKESAVREVVPQACGLVVGKADLPVAVQVQQRETCELVDGEVGNGGLVSEIQQGIGLRKPDQIRKRVRPVVPVPASAVAHACDHDLSLLRHRGREVRGECEPDQQSFHWGDAGRPRARK